MPTGYTAQLMDKGQTFNEFAMACARNFGACIMMRDEPIDTPIPQKFEPSDYYVKALSKAKDEVARFAAMSKTQRDLLGEKLKAEAAKRYEEMIVKQKKENARLQDMRRHALEWEPPTPDHNGMKEFMLDQIKISMNDTGYFERSLAEAKEKQGKDYYLAASTQAEKDISYYEDELRKEVARANDRTEWVQQLRASLKKGKK